ncbi:hypothetical protein WOLCODRAFT_122141 [Wolfiporia cocos MD-104 SS10]|uniref:F-box domain-containing protein n=1 Tax=Wolfiporia cocos (strain MD-104) TaxID=742152 RepID=A0A2H3JMY5_WOLCO|nr:hypothetical protein WOLCODRAFT_122141 [Wolfiporia cocos MD-104 SS10]
MSTTKKTKIDSTAVASTNKRNNAATRRAPRKKEKGGGGELSQISDMPLDILQEIFAYLQPVDLLHIARCTKHFRAFLMTRSSANMWKASRQNIPGLPQCPPHLSEPAYANLVFSPHCHVCLKDGVKDVIWEFSARYCGICKSKMSEWITEHSPRFPTVQFFEFLSMLTPATRQRDCWAVHKPQFEVVTSRIRELSDDPPTLDAYVQTQSAHARQMRLHVKLCHNWALACEQQRAVAVQDLKDQRLATIKDKLEAQGWGKEVDWIVRHRYDPFFNHGKVRQARILTERAWKTLNAELVPMMEEIRTKRLLEERDQIISRRLSSLKTAVSELLLEPRKTVESEYKPTHADVAIYPPIREIVDSPNDVNVTKDTFMDQRETILSFAQSWHAQALHDIANVTRKLIGLPEDADPFNLAISFVRCGLCYSAFHCSTAIIHRCLREKKNYANNRIDYIKDIYERRVCYAFADERLRPWSHPDFLNQWSAAPQVKDLKVVIRACGLDPLQATIADLDGADVWLGSKKPFGWDVSTWRGLFNVILVTDNYWMSHNTLVTVDADVKAVAKKQKEATSSQNEEARSYDGWCCALCDHVTRPVKSLHDVQRHISDCHSITDPGAEDMYLHPHFSKHIFPGHLMWYVKKEEVQGECAEI